MNGHLVGIKYTVLVEDSSETEIKRFFACFYEAKIEIEQIFSEIIILMTRYLHCSTGFQKRPLKKFHHDLTSV